MLTIPGRPVRTCEGWSRRELMRIGGAGLLGLNLPEFLSWKASAAAKVESKGKAFGAAKSVIMLFLQGGPSHIDIWDPKPNAPSNVRGDFKPIKTKVPGIEVSEVFHGSNVHTGPDEPYLFGRLRASGPDPAHTSYFSFASLHDPDGNGWVLQQSRPGG